MALLRRLLHLDLVNEGLYFAQRELIAPSMPINDGDVDLLLDRIDAFLTRRSCVLV